MEKWTVLDSSYLVQKPWATLRVDSVQLPNGHIKPDYYVLEYPTWVNMIGLTADQQLIFVRQYRHGAQQIFVELPAGVVEAGEDPLVAAQREMLEETGYGFAQTLKICSLYANPATSGNLTHTFLMLDGHKIQEQQLDDSEDIEVLLLSLEQAKELLFSNQIGQALHSAALFYALRHLNYLS